MSIKQILCCCSLFLVITQLGACAYWAEFSHQPDWSLKKQKQPESSLTHPPVYVRLVDQNESPLLSQTVSANFPPGTTALQNAIVSVLPFPTTVLVQDDAVDLQKRIGVRVKDISVRSYLQQLESVSGYSIRFIPDKMAVAVASIKTKTWHLPALASMGGFRARLGLGSGDASADLDNNVATAANDEFERSHELQTSTVYKDDVWASVVNHARCILNLDGCSSETGAEDNFDFSASESVVQLERRNAWLVNNRRLGTITATATPKEITQLDHWLQNLADNSLRMVRLDCAILDIALDESDASGFNIETMLGGDDSIQLTRQGSIANSGNNVWTVGLNLNSGRFDMDLLLENLSKRASVKIKSRARLSVTNGATAYLNTGEVFSYISDVNTVATEGVATTSFNQNRLQVGLEVAITPRLVANKNKIMLEVVPVLSSLVRFDQLGRGENATSAPVIALRQLSSQAVTQNGQPVTIGGLSWDKFSGDKQGFAEGFKLSDWFSSRNKRLESRQLLIIITPQEITV